ncbi:MAG: hypothetical protein ABIQ16_10975, partial [Polyangiaceae bacterium]
MARNAPASKRFPFVNLDGSEPHRLSAVLKWALLDRVLGRRRSGSVASPAPHVVPDLEMLSHPPQVGEP